MVPVSCRLNCEVQYTLGSHYENKYSPGFRGQASLHRGKKGWQLSHSRTRRVESLPKRFRGLRGRIFMSAHGVVGTGWTFLSFTSLSREFVLLRVLDCFFFGKSMVACVWDRVWGMMATQLDTKKNQEKQREKHTELTLYWGPALHVMLT